MYKKFLSLFYWTTSVFIVSLLSCSLSDNPATTGTATETENVAIHNPGGTPAVGARVTFLPVGYNPRTGGIGKIAAQIDSTTTDDHGNYFIKLEPGIYNVMAHGDSGVLFMDSLSVGNDSIVDPPSDTLKQAGSLTGIVQLQMGGDPRTVFILFLGTNRAFVPLNAQGIFTTANMPEGSYPVRFLTTLDDYDVLDTFLEIKSGENTVLTDAIILAYAGVPIVENCVAEWDSLKLAMRISWEALDTSKIAGYNVFRSLLGQLPTGQPLNTALEIGNEYLDTSCSLDTAYVYCVKAMSKTGDASPDYSNRDTAWTGQAYHLASTINLSQFWSYDFTPLAVNNGLIYIISNQDTSVKVMDTAGILIRTFGTTQPGRLHKPWNIRIYNNLVYIGDRSDTDVLMMEVMGPGIIKKFTLQGAFIDSIDLACPIQIQGGPYDGGDYYITPSQDVFLTTGEYIWKIASGGMRDSIAYPLDKGIIFYPKLEMNQGNLLTASGIHSFDGTFDRCQMAVVDTASLTVVSLENKKWWYRSLASDTSGKVYIVNGQNLVLINSKDNSLYAKFFVPSTVYWDVTVDFDGSVYLYDYSKPCIYRYAKR